PAPQRDGNAAPRVARLRQVFDVRDVRAALVQERDPRRVPVQRGRVVGERRERLSQRRGARPHRKQQELRRTRAVADVVHLAGGRVLRRYPLRPGPREEQGCAGRERDPVSGAHCRPPAHGAWMIVNLPTFAFPSGVLMWKKYTPLATYCSFRFFRSQYATPPPDGSSWSIASTRTPESEKIRIVARSGRFTNMILRSALVAWSADVARYGSGTVCTRARSRVATSITVGVIATWMRRPGTFGGRTTGVYA